MKKKPKEPFIPVERHETVRRKIISTLENRSLSAKEISGNIGVPEKEIYDHLEHIQKTMSAKGHYLAVTPSECTKCGFVFRKRERLKKPGRCPVCKSESLLDPLFSIKK